MKRFLPALATGAVIVASCGGGGSADDQREPPIVTLLTTTTTSTIPIFDEIEPTTSAPDGDDVPVTAPPTAPPVATAPDTTEVPEAPFELGLTGLGSASFGAEPEGVISFLGAFIGPPTSDTGYVDPFEIGACGGTQVRQVFWGSLMLEFGDVSNIADQRLHFYAYRYGVRPTEQLDAGTPDDLETPEGIGLGSSVAALIEAYPATQFLAGDDFVPPTFVVNDNLRGYLTGLTDVDTITAIIGGLPCEG